MKYFEYLKSEKASIQIIEASLIYPISIIVIVYIFIFSFLPLIEGKIYSKIEREISNIADYYEFSSFGYINGGRNELSPYRYILSLDILGNIDGIDISEKGLISREIHGESSIKYFSKEIDSRSKKKVIDQDEYMRNIEFINQLINSEELDVKTKLEEFLGVEIDIWKRKY